MKLYLEGHDLKFAAQQIYMCLFRNSHAVFSDERPTEGDFAISSMKKVGNEISCTTEIHKDGRESIAVSGAVIDKSGADEEKRLMSTAVKISFYKAALPLLERPPLWGALTGIRPAKVALKYLDEGFPGDLAVQRMHEDYFVSEGRARLAVRCAEHAKRVSEDTGRLDFSLYIGIPFCASRCRYCSFVSHSVEKAGRLIPPYLEMLSYELAAFGKTASENGLKLRSVYIGGGTPTSLSADGLKRVMEAVLRNFDMSSCSEYTVEGGRPDTIDEEKLGVIREMGATRISVNPQTMNDEILKAMDRRHTAEDVVRTIASVRKIGGLSINMDLIAGLPGDNAASFKNTVDRVIALNPENITVHSLALKKGSELRRENYLLPTNAAAEKMVEYAMNALSENEYFPYYLYRQKYMSGNLENAGYSKRGHECLYNSYIMDELHTILSAGAGGVTKLVDRENSRIKRIFNPKYPYEYNNAKGRIDEAQGEIYAFYGDGGTL